MLKLLILGFLCIRLLWMIWSNVVIYFINFLEILAGTPSYIAPEILRSEVITEKIDNFAIGAIIYFVYFFI